MKRHLGDSAKIDESACPTSSYLICWFTACRQVDFGADLRFVLGDKPASTEQKLIGLLESLGVTLTALVSDHEDRGDHDDKMDEYPVE